METARARSEGAARRDVTATTLPAPSFAERVSTTQLPLERRLPLLVLALFSVILGAWAIASYYETRRAAEAAAAERLSSLARIVATTVEGLDNMRLAALWSAARDTAIVSALRAPARPLTAEAERALSPVPAPGTNAQQPAAAQLWTADGRIVGNLDFELPVATRAFRDSLLRSPPGSRDSLLISGIQSSGRQSNVWMVAVVRDVAGNRLGYVVQQRRFGTTAQINRMLHDLVGGDGSVYIHNASGSNWVQSNGEPVSAPLRHRELFDSLGLVERPGIGTMLSASAPVHGAPLLVTIEQPLHTIIARQTASLRVLGGLALLFAATGAFLSWIATRRLVRPLTELTDAAEAIANGEVAWRVDVGRTDEIGRLGAVFNRMVQRVEDSAAASAGAVARLTRSVETQEFLAEASRIVAGSLSDERLLADLARHCVPRLADYCTIHVAEDDGTIRRIATVHRDRLKQEAVVDLMRRFKYRVDGPGEVPEVIRSQRPMIVPVIDREAVRASIDSEDMKRLLQQVAPNSFMCIPLIARGRAFGAMSFTMTTSGRRFSEEDLEIATEVVRRTAVAIDNTLIYRRSLDLRLEAESASNAKSDFLAKMSHEIRTPINAMMGYAELLQMGIAGPVTAAQATQLSRIRASGEHLTSMIGEILDLSKIEAGRMGVESAVGVVGDVAEAALGLIRPAATTKGVDLDARLQGIPKTVYVGDPQRVQQILTNLLGNAVKFTPAGGCVSIACGSAKRGVVEERPGSPWATITVQDTGVGIAPSDLERIFQPFVQVDGGYTRSHGGTGLGLTISRNLAQMMGGDITVESVLGEGSRFTVWLPTPAPTAN
jgi:signal transduction histidine kinase